MSDEDHPARRRRKPVSDAVAETSTELKDEIKKAEAPARVTFGSANAATLRPLDPSLEAVVEAMHVPTEEIHPRYKKLMAAKELGDRRSEQGWVRFKAEEAVSLLWDAKLLHIAARSEREAWEKDNQIIFGAHRLEATRTLQDEKDRGVRSKQITDADVEAMCAAMFKEEWRAVEVTRARLKETVEGLAHLIVVFDHWCQTTRKLVG